MQEGTQKVVDSLFDSEYRAGVVAKGRTTLLDLRLQDLTRFDRLGAAAENSFNLQSVGATTDGYRHTRKRLFGDDYRIGGAELIVESAGLDSEILKPVHLFNHISDQLF